MPLEAYERAHRHAELSDLVGAAELRQVDDEAGGEHLGAHPAQQLDGALGGAAKLRKLDVPVRTLISFEGH